MLVSLDVITRKKLILVKQIYQRALIQSQFTHRVIDRMLAVVGFDLANETLLKATAVALNPTIKLERYFAKVIEQVEAELRKVSNIKLDKTKIQHVHDIRNATQHHARFPSDIEVSDSRTYTRDFLTQTFSDVWGEPFESISLVDVIQNVDVKNLLLEAEQEFVKNDYTETVIKSMAAFEQTIGGLANLLTNRIDYQVDNIVVEEGSKGLKPNRNVFNAFIRTRELIIFQTIGINPQEYLKYKRFTRFIYIALYGGGKYKSAISGPKPIKEEAEYVLNFVINSIVQVESLDEDITKPYDHYR